MRERAIPAMCRLALMFASLAAPVAAAHATPPLPPAPPVTALDEVDTKVCHFAATEAVEPDAGLPLYLTKHLVLPNGDDVSVAYANAGIDYIEMKDGQGTPIDPGYPDDVDPDKVNDPNEYYTTPEDRGVRLLPFMGRAYVLDYVGNQPFYLHEIDRLTPDRHILPVCRFKPNVTVMLMPAESFDHARLCERIQQGRLRAVKERAIPGRRPINSMVAIESAASSRVDFRNIGRPQALIREEFSETGHNACESSMIRIRGKASRRDIKLLEKLQDKTSTRFYAPGMLSAGCADDPARWITDGRKTYLEMRSHHHDHPLSEDAEYWLVSTVDRGRAHRVCEGFYKRNPPTLVSIWNGRAWVPAPGSRPMR